MVKNISNELVIVLGGEAGQGIQSIESILSVLLKRSGYNFFSASEFMSRVRGGSNSTEIRISSKRVAGYVDRIDILIPLHAETLVHLKKRIKADTVVLDINFAQIAIDVGGAIFSGTVAAGFICGLLKVDEKECESFILEYFARKTEDIQQKNIQALKRGYAEGKGNSSVNVSIDRSPSCKDDLILAGADAIALGALAGGCNYVCGYPMSPATSVLEKMATYSLKHDIIVEQVEDEIGVVNMALGAWYGGARALVSTSGGGFALMTEGISLCGIIESPFVLHLAQRPGPATGLPTRTEQGDLNLVLYAGHGDFPRIILAPGTLEEGFYLTQKAFNLADAYQVPVFILTDQFYVDSKYNTPAFNLSHIRNENHIVETGKEYKRFSFFDTGISPRGIPGFGVGAVCVDSDEHDESGHITEDSDMRILMVDKRNKKMQSIQKEIIGPTLFGPESYRVLVICWGSTFNTVKEAVEGLKKDDVAVLHFSWIFPLPENAGDYARKAENLIIVENNSSGQFAQLIKLSTGIVADKMILKYDGLPFTVEEIQASIREGIQKKLPEGGSVGQ